MAARRARSTGRNTAHRCVSCVASLALVAAPAGALAQRPAPAVAAAEETPEQMIDRAVALRRARTRSGDEEAQALLVRAVERQRSPRALAQLGLVEQALGAWVDAETHLREALAARGDAWLEGRRAALQGAYETVLQNTAVLELSGGPDAAELRVNGQPRGALGEARRVRIPAGRVVIEVRAPGFEPFERRVSANGGDAVRQPVELLALRPEALAGGPARGEGAGENGAARTPSPAAAPERPAGRTAGWVLLGVGAGAAAIGALVLNRVRADAVRRFNDDAHCGVDPSRDVVVGGAACAQIYDAARPLGPATWATLGLGGAVVATGVVLLLAYPASRAPSASASARAGGAWSCGPSLAYAGASCAGAF